MKSAILSCCLALALFAVVLPSRTQAGEEPYLGEISLFAGEFAPRGWHFCTAEMAARRSLCRTWEKLKSDFFKRPQE